jgi:replicative DNA helicase
MADVALLSLFLKDRPIFERFSGAVPKHLLEEDTRLIMDDLTVWYNQHQQSEGLKTPEEVQDFWSWLKLTRHANRPKDKMDLMKAFIGRALREDTREQANEILKTLTLRDWAGRIAEKADRFSTGDVSFDLFEELYSDVDLAKIEAGIHDRHDHEVLDSLEDILAEYDDMSNGLHWRSPNLNMAIGPIRQGDLVVTAAFVDTGKSTWLASETSFMASQLAQENRKVLYLNNEERGRKVKLRLWKAALGLTHEQIADNIPKAQALWREKMHGSFEDRFVLVDTARITPGMIRRKLRENDIGLIVVDQAYKVRVSKRGQDDKLGALQDTFEYFRGLAKEHCPVIAIHQARGDANGEQYIEMHQLAGSQQALQGEADAIITLGRTLPGKEGDDEDDGARYIYVPKNKMETPGDPTMRNLKCKVYPRFEVARFDE